MMNVIGLASAPPGILSCLLTGFGWRQQPAWPIQGLLPRASTPNLTCAASLPGAPGTALAADKRGTRARSCTSP
jgi:hypothetical protein